jgi:uncharacterized RDD family membrane protein YckC
MQWYYAIDGQRLGPVPHAELERLVKAGTVKGDTLLWRQGLDQWKTLADVRERDPAMFAEVPPPLPEAESQQHHSPAEETAATHRAPGMFSDEKPAAPDAPPYAGFWRRAGAFLVDAIIWLFVWNSILNVVALSFPGIIKIAQNIEAAGGGFHYKPTTDEAVLLAKFFMVVMMISVIWALVYDLIFLRRFSATPGKLLFGLRVEQADGEPLSFGRIVARTFAKLIAGLPTLFIGFLIVAFDDQKRGLHDFFCKTRVVKKRD